MTSGAAAAVILGAVALLGAWLFGAVPLAPAGVGLVCAGGLVTLWRLGCRTGAQVTTTTVGDRPTEGDRLLVDLRLDGRLARWSNGTARAGGVLEAPVRRGRATLLVERVPRGRYEVGPVHVELQDPLGLDRVELAAPSSSTVLVRPRVAVLDATRADAGRTRVGGRRPALLHASGVELHGVRDYQQGEALRLVHWPTTARRGELFVRELEESPLDEDLVVLDCAAEGDVGPRGESSFDEAVRVAASVLRAQAAQWRPVTLVLSGATRTMHRVRGLDGTYEEALDGLAEVTTGPSVPLASVILERHRLGRAGARLLLVTCRVDRAAFDRLEPGRDGVVVVDAPTYAGREPSPPDPVLLRLVAHGVTVAVVRRGDDLTAALTGRPREAASA